MVFYMVLSGFAEVLSGGLLASMELLSTSSSLGVWDLVVIRNLI